jgi:hypothetical protein
MKSGKNDDINQHPDVAEINQEIENYNMRAEALTNGFEDNLKAHQNRIKRITRTMRTNITPLERSVLKLVLNDARKTHNLGLKAKRKALAAELKAINSTRKYLEKQRKTDMSKIRKTMKKEAKERKAIERDAEKAEKKLRKTLRKQGELKEEIKNEMLKGLVSKYSDEMDKDLGNLYTMADEKAALMKEKEAAVLEKAKIKEEKAKEKKRIQEEKAKAKEEKAKEKERTRKEKEEAKKEKMARKTKKNV